MEEEMWEWSGMTPISLMIGTSHRQYAADRGVNGVLFCTGLKKK